VGCQADADCPKGHTCADGKDVDGKTVKQCRPAAGGTCTCSGWALTAGATTTCADPTGACSGQRSCTAGEVKAGDPVPACDAPDATTETCDGVDNDCDGQTDTGAPCSDDVDCTVDTCAGTKGCQSAASDAACDDKQACTHDICSATKGCIHLPAAASCTDGDACTSGDSCAGGKCVPGAKTDCDDDNPCSVDGCDPKVGCKYSHNVAPCDDGNICSLNDKCNQGLCLPGQDLNCDDGNGCTNDSCHKKTGCKATANTAKCDDGQGCTGEDTCKAGTCVGSPISCDDGNDCTADACDAKTAKCLHVAKGGPCEDGDLCRDATCLAGKCTQVPTWAVSQAAGGFVPFADGKGDKARVSFPHGLDFDAKGNLLVADMANDRIRSVAPDGTVTTLAGGQRGFADGKGAAARFNGPAGVAAGATGQVYVADRLNNRLRVIATGGNVTTLAGGEPGFADGNGAAARFDRTWDLAVHSEGDIFVSDVRNHRIRRVTPDGAVSTFAGGAKGKKDGKGTAASFVKPSGLAIDAKDTLYVADRGNSLIRRIAADGTVTTIAGSTYGFADGAAKSASFARPFAIAVDAKGTLYVGDTFNSKVRTIALDGTVKTLAGSGTGYVDGKANVARFYRPFGVAVDAKGVAHVSDWGNSLIRRVAADGTTSTFVGALNAGFVDGKASLARFDGPRGVAADSHGHVYIADYDNHAIRRMAPDGAISTVAGGTKGLADGVGKAAKFYRPIALHVAPSGLIYAADNYNHAIRQVTPLGEVTTVVGGKGAGAVDGPSSGAKLNSPHGLAMGDAGVLYVADSTNHRIRAIAWKPGMGATVATLAGSSKGYADGKGAAAKFDLPYGLTLGNDGLIYITEIIGNRIRRITPAGVVTTVAGGGTSSSFDGLGKSARFLAPSAIDVLPSGDLVVVGSTSNRIRRVSPSGKVVTLAGGENSGYTDGVGALARFGWPWGVAVGVDGAIYVSDVLSRSVRKLADPNVSCSDDKWCTADACDPKSGKCGHTTAKDGALCLDGDPCTTSSCVSGACKAKAKTCDDGSVCTTDSCIKGSGVCANVHLHGKCDDGKACTWTDCIAGQCATVPKYSVGTLAGRAPGVADGPALNATFRVPADLDVAPDGSIWIADTRNQRIRRLDKSGNISSVAGNVSGFGDGKGEAASFLNPNGIALDAKGVAWVADTNNHAIRRVAPDGTVSTLAGAGESGFAEGNGKAARFARPTGLAVDAKGNVYVADRNNHRVRKVAPDGTVSTFAGGASGYADGKGSAAKFNAPNDVAVDAKGRVWVADYSNRRVRRIDLDGTVTTVAGSGSGGSGNGKGKAATFNRPNYINTDGKGGVVLSDVFNHRIRQVGEDGVVTTIAGSGLAGDQDGPAHKARFVRPAGVAVGADGVVLICDNWNNKIKGLTGAGQVVTVAGHWLKHADGRGSAAAFFHPIDVAADDKGNAFVVENAGVVVRRIAPDGTVSTYAGSGVAGTSDGPAAVATFSAPVGITVDPSGNVFVSGNSKRLRKISPQGMVTTLAGNHNAYKDGTGSAALFSFMGGMAADSKGVIWVADSGNRRIRRVTPDGVVTTFAGDGKKAAVDGKGTAASFEWPVDVEVDKQGRLWVSDGNVALLRRITPDGLVTTVAGGKTGFVDGLGKKASFSRLGKLTIAPDGAAWVIDRNNIAIRRVAPNGVVTTPVAASRGHIDGHGMSAAFVNLTGITAMPDGRLLVVELFGDTVRELKPPKSDCDDGNPCTADKCDAKAGCSHAAATGACDDGVACTIKDTCSKGSCAGTQRDCDDGKDCTKDWCVAATGACANTPRDGACEDGDACASSICQPSGACKATTGWLVETIAGIGGTEHKDGPPDVAQFSHPFDVAIDAKGNVLVADHTNHRIRRITPSGQVSTVAGTGEPGAVDGKGDVARFKEPWGVGVDGKGGVLVAEPINHLIRYIDAKGVVSTLAGNGKPGFAEGKGKAAMFNFPRDVTAGPDGHTYVVDRLNARIRKIAADGTVSTFVGNTKWGYADGKGAAVRFRRPACLAFNSKGDLFVTDTDNHRIRKVTPDGTVSTVAGGAAGYKDGKGSASQFNKPQGIGVDGKDNIFVADWANQRIRRVAPDGTVTTAAGDGKLGYINGPAASARLAYPYGLAVTAAGAVVIADTSNSVIRYLATNGLISTYAGSGALHVDGPGELAAFKFPVGIAMEASGDLVVADFGNHAVRRVSQGGKTTTLAGGGINGFVDGPGVSARLDGPRGVAIGTQGEIYVADMNNFSMRRLSTSGQLATLAGNGSKGFVDGKGPIARFGRLFGIARAANGSIFAADYDNNRIRVIAPDGTVTTYAGSGKKSSVDGKALEASFNGPGNVAFDGVGNLYVTEIWGHRVRRISVDGVVSTVAGSGKAGYKDGAGPVAMFERPGTIAATFDGVLYVAGQNSRLRRVGIDGAVTTIAGSDSSNFSDGPAALATIQPAGMVLGAGGVIWATSHNRIRKLIPPKANCDDLNACTADACSSQTGVCSHLAKSCDDGNVCTNDVCDPASGNCANTESHAQCDDGNACTTANCIAGKCVLIPNWIATTWVGGGAGHVDGKGDRVRFNWPTGVHVDGKGDTWVADTSNDAIRKLTPDGAVSTVAGGFTGFADGKGAAARFHMPEDVVADDAGVAWVADGGNSRVRRIAADGVVSTFAGSTRGYADGKGTAAQFKRPAGLALDDKNMIWVADGDDHRIRRIDPQGVVTTIAGSKAGLADGPGFAAMFNTPEGIDVDAKGYAWVADRRNHALRRISPTGVVETIAGGKSGFKDGPVAEALLKFPFDVAVDAKGQVLIADEGNRRLRRLDLAGSMSTVAGSGVQDAIDGLADAAGFSRPRGVAIDGQGNTIVAGFRDQSIRKVTPDGMVSTIAGEASRGYREGRGQNARLRWPAGVAVKADGSGLIADAKNHVLRHVTSDGLVSTLAGSGKAGFADGKGAAAMFNDPRDVIRDSKGNAHVADYVNQRVRTVAPDGTVTTLAGSGGQGSVDAKGSKASFAWPRSLAIDSKDRVYVADWYSNRVRRVAPDGTVSTLSGSGAAGHVDGAKDKAQFGQLSGIAVDKKDRVWVVSRHPTTKVGWIRRVDTDGSVQTIANAPGTGEIDGVKGVARITTAYSLALGPSDSMITTRNFAPVRRIEGNETVTTLAPNLDRGFRDGRAALMRTWQPLNLHGDGKGKVWLADSHNDRIRVLQSGQSACDDGDVCTIDKCDKKAGCLHSPASGKCDDGDACTANDACSKGRCTGATKNCSDGNACTADTCDGTTAKCLHSNLVAPCDDGDKCTTTACLGGKCAIDKRWSVTTIAGSIEGYLDGPAAQAEFAHPHTAIVRANGDIWISDAANHRIRSLNTKGQVGTVAGSGVAGVLDGAAAKAQFNGPRGLWDDGKGRVYISDRFNHRIRYLDAKGDVKTLAGSTKGFADGKGAAAQLNEPQSLFMTAAGALLFTSAGGHRVRKVTADGVVSTIAGSGVKGFKDGPSGQAQFNGPRGIVMDSKGDILVVDYRNHRIRKIDSKGNVSTVIGSSKGFADGKGAAVQLSYPGGLALAGGGSVVFNDGDNKRIRHLAADGTVTSLVGALKGVADGKGEQARFRWPAGIMPDGKGGFLVGDYNGHAIRRVSPPPILCAP